ncbi:MAG TPA: hypothetical protein PK280_14405 [Planctomycetota bacterium]|nr:hypothetical protein [Planctomycetota bacterium]
MLIERQVSVALILVGGTLVLPDTLAVARGTEVAHGAGLCVVGNLLAGVGLFLISHLLLDHNQAVLWRVLAISLLSILALLFVTGAGLVALHATGAAAVWRAVGALPPALGTGLGIAHALRE